VHHPQSGARARQRAAAEERRLEAQALLVREGNDVHVLAQAREVCGGAQRL
jgi:hypothetical protein